MPRYYRDYGGGYDLDRELPFRDVDGIGRCQLGSANSFILICRQCFNERFRDSVWLDVQQPCYRCGGPMSVLTFDLADQLRPDMEARGIKFTTVEYRRRKRLEYEASHPHDWQFGDKTEADYPSGYVKEGA